MPKADIYYIEVLGKALHILDVFVATQKPCLTLQELSKATALNKNTVFRVLHTLTEHGYLVKRQHNYELGAKVLDLGHGNLRRRDLVAVCGPFLDALRNEFGETINLGVLEGGQIRYVDVRESPHRFRLAERIGGSDFLHCTALGKAWLAYLPFEQVRQLLKEQEMESQTERTIVTLTRMKIELARIRKQGYAVDAEESMPGAYCVGAPVLDVTESPVAAISISGPTVRFDSKSLPRASLALMKAVAAIRVQLGYAR